MKGSKMDLRTVSARKDLHAVLGNFFAEQLPQMGSVTREPCLFGAAKGVGRTVFRGHDLNSFWGGVVSFGGKWGSVG